MSSETRPHDGVFPERQFAETPTWALTLTQPWATLVAIQAKVIETRDWSTRHRGPLAIHAAKGFPSEARRLVYEEPFRSVLREIGIESFEQLPTASIVAVATLEKCYRFTAESMFDIEQMSKRGRLPRHEYAFGDHHEGRFGFMLTNIVALTTPVPARGMQLLWRLPDDVRGALTEELRAA